MKKILTFIIVLLSFVMYAQVPQKMSYQSVVRNSNNELISNQQVGLRISILQGSVSGNEVYSELQNLTTNVNGLISLQFGGGNDFESIDWGTGTYFIKTEIDPDGGTNYSIEGVSQLLSVPYALYAENAANISNNNINNPSNAPVNFVNRPVGFLVWDSDNNKVHAYSIHTGTWASQSVTSFTSTNAWRVSGNFLVNDFNSNVVYAFSSRTGAWTSINADVTASDMLFSNANGNFLVNDRNSNLIHAFNGQTGVWTSLSVGSVFTSQIFITVD